MPNSEKKFSFEIKPTIEQMPFKNPAVRSFFEEWCRINDGIEPKFVGRSEWEEIGAKDMLEKRSDGKFNLFLPFDLQLWEMVGVLEVVDKNTFAKKPEKQAQKKEEVIRLGKTLRDAGVYIAQRLDAIDEGKAIAESLAEEFYNYGKSVMIGKKPEREIGAQAIVGASLTPEETEAIDQWLAGEKLYAARRAKAEEVIEWSGGNKEELYEAERIKTLSRFFRVAEKAFRLQNIFQSQEGGPAKQNIKPWQSDTPVHSAFLKKVEGRIIKTVETPKRELNTAIFRRGLEKLVSEMRELPKTENQQSEVDKFFKKLGIDLPLEQRKLVDALNLPKLKKKLDAARRKGDIAEISELEREIALKIQRAVSSFTYESRANNPAEIVATQYINCVGASTLGGALLSEVGINYLVGHVPHHSITVLVTSDGKLMWQDMLNPRLNEELTDEMIGGEKNAAPLKVADIVEYSKHPSEGSLMFDIISENYQDKIRSKGERQYLAVSPPVVGQQMSILHNTGNALRELDRPEEAIEAYRQAIAIDPNHPYPYFALGKVLRSLGRLKEAIEVYRQAVVVNPRDATSFVGLGNTFYETDRFEEAVDVYRQAVVVNPKYANAHLGLGNALFMLGHGEEALREYREFMNIEDKRKTAEQIEFVNIVIPKLERELAKQSANK